MEKDSETPNVGKLGLQDDGYDDTEDLFASPSTTGANTQKHTPSSNQSSAQKHARNLSKQDAAEEREARLRAELEQIKAVNRTIEGVTASLTKARDNMDTVNRTRLILNPNWQGATQDIEDMENEEVRRQQEAERRVTEEQRRREEAQRRAEEEERRKAAAAPVARRGSVKSVRGTRASSMRAGYVGVGGQPGRGRGTASTTSTRETPSAGRAASTRGRGRGVG